MYQGTLSAVRVNGELSVWFETVTGVRQGCVLSPLLFNIFLEAVMALATEGVESGVNISGYVIDNLRFADDIAALAENNKDLQYWIKRLAEESAYMGMKMNTDKTETQYIGKNPQPFSITVDGKQLNRLKVLFILEVTLV